jgi:methanogenic corrinoid protein MtbC1
MKRSSRAPRRSPSPGYGIGALARAVGVPVQTLRTWESRYGYPTAERLSSGHRRYPPETVERLRLVMQLLAQGHKPSSVVAADPETLEVLLRVGQVPTSTRPRPRSSAGRFATWFDAVERFDVAALDALLRHGWATAGAVPFLQDELAPFLDEVGRRWESGRIDVAHEHFASKAIGLFLGRQWRAMSDVSSGPLAVCATFEGERHELGLHMAAVGLALGGWRIRFLGADTPLDSIVTAATTLAADAILIGASASSDPNEVHTRLKRLRRELPRGPRVFAGGIPAPEGEVQASWPGTIAALMEATSGSS